ncbi:hypothetical protein IFM89_037573 [Coptis chinensis]|uniref:TFIIS N-terminal domain-containing protein n=1 Tax=Coptis chinensis TaxID=261450 RepID=A0A835LSY8_9MAGN|nr:hypothetical protein IFM89_037573 [Coptis chinensis]
MGNKVEDGIVRVLMKSNEDNKVQDGIMKSNEDNAIRAKRSREEELNDLFDMGKRKMRVEKTAAETALYVEKIIAELEVAAEDDAEFNRECKPAINKLKKLPLLTQALSEKLHQQEFLEHGLFNLLRKWLEPLPDGSLPNIAIRTKVLEILSDYPLGLEHLHRREELGKSGLGKAINFLSMSNEESTRNRKLAQHLVNNWSRYIFNNRTRYDLEVRSNNVDRVFYKRPSTKRATGLGFSQGRNQDFIRGLL